VAMSSKKRLLTLSLSAAVLGSVSLSASSAGAQERDAMTSFTTYGTPGIIDMPSALMAPDADLTNSFAVFEGTVRGSLTFQVMPRLTGSFRYSQISPWDPSTGAATYDRSLDLRYQFLTEGPHRPAMAVGVQDFIGTGVYAGEYVVATKHVNPKIAVTGGIGWGRYGSYNGFTNPLGIFSDKFKTRPSGFSGTGGQIEGKRWFRGDAAFFGGVTWQATDKLLLKAEYSSDAYVQETSRGGAQHKTPFNVGVQYRLSKGIDAQAFYLYGSQIGAAISFTLNPKYPTVNGTSGPGGTPVVPRASGAAADLGWTTQADGPVILRDNVETLLAGQGLVLEAIEIKATSVTIQFRNERYLPVAQAVGRIARVLTATMPASVETFIIVPVVNGMDTSAIILQRSDLERLEFDPNGSAESAALAQITEAPPHGSSLVYSDDLLPRLVWNFGPYARTSFFDPDQPVRGEFGLQLHAEYWVQRGLYFSGTVQKRIVGNLDKITRNSNSTLPHVRSDANLYAKYGDPAITDLTAAYYFRPGKDLYGRVTGGYLERMFGGLSTEVLWKPVDSRLAIGAEVDFVRQRNFDQLFGFQDYQTVTGLVSTYWDMGNGFQAQVDAGRYLAKDWGGTVSIDRVFNNGWRIGAFATVTNVSPEDYGEGSFDKGIRFTIPMEFILGKPSTKKYGVVLRSLTRDGGAKLSVDGRLYDSVRSYHAPQVYDGWGRFWR
jgi:hypothetical protein